MNYLTLDRCLAHRSANMLPENKSGLQEVCVHILRRLHQLTCQSLQEAAAVTGEQWEVGEHDTYDSASWMETCLSFSKSILLPNVKKSKH